MAQKVITTNPAEQGQEVLQYESTPVNVNDPKIVGLRGQLTLFTSKGTHKSASIIIECKDPGSEAAKNTLIDVLLILVRGWEKLLEYQGDWDDFLEQLFEEESDE
ncbi:hypothetical protein ACFL1P_01570 [Patescibacteria group bacterium]